MDLITQAQLKLVKHPYDIYHDIGHHYKVLDNCLLIGIEEKLKPNFVLLEKAVWCHDLNKNSKNEYQLLNRFLSQYCTKKETAEIIQLIKEHPYKSQQNSIESKLLYDADKLELVSIPRWKRAFDAYEYDEISLEERDRYVQAWNKRINNNIVKTLHYRTSLEIFNINYNKFVEWLKSINRYKNGELI